MELSQLIWVSLTIIWMIVLGMLGIGVGALVIWRYGVEEQFWRRTLGIFFAVGIIAGIMLSAWLYSR